MLTRIISEIATFMQSHPRWIELARRGPRHDDPVDVDAMSSIRQRLTSRAEGILEQAVQSVGIDPAVFRRLPAAIATMHSGVLQDWLADPRPARSRDDVVSELARFTWHLLDGAAREVGLDLDPHVEIAELLTQLATSAAEMRGADTPSD